MNEFEQYDRGLRQHDLCSAMEHAGPCDCGFAPRHEHDWIDATNEHVSDTAWCPCGKLARLGEITVTDKTTDELRTLYPDVKWKATA